ncbi:MAG: hypothetical protein ACFE95_12395 [Candidatus Hodarchaeota archaeon]
MKKIIFLSLITLALPACKGSNSLNNFTPKQFDKTKTDVQGTAIFIYPKSFAHNNIEGRTNTELCVDALNAWAIKIAGFDVPNFTEIMIKIAEKLDIKLSEMPQCLIIYSEENGLVSSIK